MGCASSKQSQCQHCENHYSPLTRSYSTHVPHLPEGHGDNYHVVALTSATLGSLGLATSNPNIHIHGTNIVKDDVKESTYDDEVVIDRESKSKDFSLGVIETETWSNIINEKMPKMIPKTPIRTPPSEPETINAWELMEGLEDVSPLHPQSYVRSFLFGFVPNPKESGRESPSPLWLQMDGNEDLKTVVAEFDPDVISTFRKALEELSPAKQIPPKPQDYEKPHVMANIEHKFESVDTKNVNTDVTPIKFPMHRKNKVVVYFTSLRGVRKTYEDSCRVRVILKGLGLCVDERDVSMHSGFKEELKELMGEGFTGGSLPRVFVGGRYIGGAEEIRRMNEEGQLEKVLEGCEMVDDGGDGGRVCEACGDIRFVPCETCSGSCKIYYDYDEKEGKEEEDDGDEYGFRRCPDCNENGIIRCPICCD
ncbi:uncharacterized protein At3g28850-like [Malania oleifera]|uniref:uncharacterized protein At3g28850-like n=1 Tax=Malania oleifera TaxID=397392 RepID=UPI0025ADE619|nr:uncharacterized protein At3g28850-like [Malania oleifera]